MRIEKLVRRMMVVACLAACSDAIPIRAQKSGPDAIQVYFENSCSPRVQDAFRNGVTLLHSFEYPESSKVFRRIMAQDPGCAMARWGVAMSIWHPLWAPPSQAELIEGARVLSDTSQLETTPRETAYLEAIKRFFSSDSTHTHALRARQYEEAMAGVYAGHLNDPEAAIFYALSLLATADPRDKSYAHQFKAAGLLNWVLQSQPTHPGVLHYLIHSYDFPGMAHLALDVAKIYAAAAPDSAHAQHMPSHIFTRLGLWERSLSSNHDSTRSAAEYTRRARLPGHYDEGLHSMDYLMYAMLQTARDREAETLLVRLRNVGKTDTENFKVAYTYAASPARYALERRAWKEASALQLVPAEFLWDDFGFARAIHHFARGIGAARSGQTGRAGRELAKIQEIGRELPDTALRYWKEEVQVQIDAVRSWILLAEDRVAAALKLAAAAADREDAVDKHPVTPGEVLPARELFADMLYETGRYEESLRQYHAVLRGAPNRLNALLGAQRAAKAVGDSALAREYSAIVRTQVQFGNRQRAGLEQVWERSGAKQ